MIEQNPEIQDVTCFVFCNQISKLRVSSDFRQIHEETNTHHLKTITFQDVRSSIMKKAADIPAGFKNCPVAQLTWLTSAVAWRWIWPSLGDGPRFAAGETGQPGWIQLLRSTMRLGTKTVVRKTSVTNFAREDQAILQAGIKILAAASDDECIPLLYLSLAVLPDGYPFTVKDAAALLHDRVPSPRNEWSARRIVQVLESWDIVCSLGTTYCMHSAHSEFARRMLEERGDVLGNALTRWTTFISRLGYLRSADPRVLKALWARVGVLGESKWDNTRPYVEAIDNLYGSYSLLFRQSAEAIARYQEA